MKMIYNTLVFSNALSDTKKVSRRVLAAADFLRFVHLF